MTGVKWLIAGLVLFAALQGYIRLAPLPEAGLSARPGPMSEGVHTMPGGVKLVRPLAGLPPGAFDRLLAIAAATPRTRRLGQGDEPAAFVTRSALWGFPDIATIWVADGNLHVYSHSVFGRGDLGVNAAKVARWMAALETAPD